MSAIRIRTGLNILVGIVNKKGEVRLAEAAKMLDLDVQSLEGLVNILVEQRILEMHYSLIGDKILCKGDKMKVVISSDQIKEKVEESLGSQKASKSEGTKEVEKLLGVMKRKIAEKRGNEQNGELCKTALKSDSIIPVLEKTEPKAEAHEPALEAVTPGKEPSPAPEARMQEPPRSKKKTEKNKQGAGKLKKAP